MDPDGTPRENSGPVLAARCGAMRDVSARLREQARALCEASALLRRLTQSHPRLIDEPSGVPPGRRLRGGDVVVRCVLCGERVSARDLSVAVGRPTHSACYNRHLQAHEIGILNLLGEGSAACCRACLATKVGLPIEQINAISGRLLAQRAIRTAAGTCRFCRHPRLVLAPVPAPTARV